MSKSRDTARIPEANQHQSLLVALARLPKRLQVWITLDAESPFVTPNSNDWNDVATQARELHDTVKRAHRNNELLSNVALALIPSQQDTCGAKALPSTAQPPPCPKRAKSVHYTRGGQLSSAQQRIETSHPQGGMLFSVSGVVGQR